MASIAYITDKNMIEYHRINGNKIINFWRPSNTKKISNFNKGDYLFFLAKGTEKGKEKEKGIVGYGKLSKSYALTFDQMWDRYGKQNGYANKESLLEAIQKISKTDHIAEYLSCFILEECTYFQGPIYLSEVGMHISNKLESYLYLDKDNLFTTSKILELANGVGQDMWALLCGNQDDHDMLLDAKLSIIQNMYDRCNGDDYTTHDLRMLYKYASSIVRSNPTYQFIPNCKSEFIKIDQNKIVIYLVSIVNTLEFDKKIQSLLGKYCIYSSIINESSFKDELSVCLLFNQPISDNYKKVLHTLHIPYEERLVID